MLCSEHNSVANEQQKTIRKKLAYLIQFGLLTGKRESETQWEFLLLHANLLHETCQTVSNVVK